MKSFKGVRTLHWASVIVRYWELSFDTFHVCWYKYHLLLQATKFIFINDFTKIRRNTYITLFSGEKWSLIPWPPSEIKTITWGLGPYILIVCSLRNLIMIFHWLILPDIITAACWCGLVKYGWFSNEIIFLILSDRYNLHRQFWLKIW